MNGDWSITISGQGDVDAARTACSTFVDSLKSNGQTISTGAFSSSEQLDNLTPVATQVIA